MKTILVVEDHPPMRENLVLMLEMEGFRVLSAAAGRAGVDLAVAEVPHLILCDVMMPDLDGYGVLQSVRANPLTATIPFIFVTARGEKLDQRVGMNLGADDYLVKPVLKEDLLAAIAARLQRHNQHEQRTQTKLREIKFSPDFNSAVPLQSLGLSPRQAEVLLWIAQGKTNEEIGIILGASRNTIKKHVLRVLDKLGVESRNTAAVRALEFLSSAGIEKTSPPLG
jgi:DNA-binding NarL/FixJ family response regulator